MVLVYALLVVIVLLRFSVLRCGLVSSWVYVFTYLVSVRVLKSKHDLESYGVLILADLFLKI